MDWRQKVITIQQKNRKPFAQLYKPFNRNCVWRWNWSATYRHTHTMNLVVCRHIYTFFWSSLLNANVEIHSEKEILKMWQPERLAIYWDILFMSAWVGWPYMQIEWLSLFDHYRVKCGWYKKKEKQAHNNWRRIVLFFYGCFFFLHDALVSHSDWLVQKLEDCVGFFFILEK